MALTEGTRHGGAPQARADPIITNDRSQHSLVGGEEKYDTPFIIPLF